MEKETAITAHIKAQALLPLFYHTDPSVCTAVVQALYTAGVRSVEFTNRGTQALPNFTTLIEKRNKQWPGLLLGAGTIKNSQDANNFIEAGADFLISPFFDSGVCDAAYQHKVPWLPGCMTPTEIHTACQAGCTFIKLFPGNVLTPGFLMAVTPLFPGIEFMVTGGVDTTAESIGAWLGAGAAAVGMGSGLVTKAVLETGNYEMLVKNTGAVLNTIQHLKS